ncbi:MAG: hypothetical protein GY877_03240 [Hyphomicrobium sp.]|nr:hypothetical protein [Hyphomicrobium sp.]
MAWQDFRQEARLMSKVEQDARLNRRLTHDRPGRRFLANDDARWGELILPAPDENPAKTTRGLRVLLIASTALSCRAVKTVVAYEHRHPERVNLVGLVTDDPIDADARIGIKKRVWKFLDDRQRLEVETAIVEVALSAGAPVYTGEIKVEWFSRQATHWHPDVILVCGFGQVIDQKIIGLPLGGIYNFHPSDLAHHHGAGPAPYDDYQTCDLATTVWTVHQMVEAVDAGPILGQSPPINIRDQAGSLPEEPMLVYNKLIDPLAYMVYFLLDALAQRYHRGEMRPLEQLDFERRFPASVKAQIMAPIVSQEIVPLLTGPDSILFDLE